MTQERWKEQCSRMTDRELVRAATIDREEFHESFLEIVAGELDRRKIDLSRLAEPVKLRFNDQAERPLAIEEALAELKKDMTARDAWSLTNYLEETLVIQKDAAGILVHYFFDDQYHRSFLADSFETLAQMVRQFCRFEDWCADIQGEFSLDDWTVLVSSPSSDFIDIITLALGKFNVPYIIRGTNLPQHDVIMGGSGNQNSLNILIPEEHVETANEVLQEIDQTILSLHKQAKEWQRKGDLLKELEALDYLAKLQPEDEAVFFNRASILFNLERYGDAAHSFIQAAINGRAAMHLTIVEEAEAYLHEILQKMPDNLEILHALAAFSREDERPTETEAYYRKIITLKPDDEIAHLNLGYSYYQDESRNEKALHHFRTYLALKPGADDREAVEEIIKEIEGPANAQPRS